jgi:predicted lysophospholipase L1 biosynthesis ABC-type transport system permease subunit
MIRSVLRSAIAGRSAWWAVALVSVVSALLLVLCLAQVESADDPAVRAVLGRTHLTPEDLTSMGASLEMLAVPTAVIVLAVVGSAALGQRAVDLARWRLAGARATTLMMLSLGQIVLCALAGGVVGAVLGALLSPYAVSALNGMMVPAFAGIAVTASGRSLLQAIALSVVAALIAGLPPSLRACRVPAVRAVSGEEEPEGGVGPLRWAGTVLGVLLLLGVATWGGFRATADGGAEDAMTIGLGLGVLVVAVCGLGARVLVPLLVHGWTRLVPLRAEVWELARRGAAARARVSGAAIVAFASGTAVLGVLTGIARTSEAVARELGDRSQYNYVDIYVICGIIGLLSALGGMCVLALGAADRRREVAVLRAAGMTPVQVLAAASCEAVVLGLTGLVIACAATSLGTSLMPWAAAHAGQPIVVVLPVRELLIGTAVTILMALCALLVPALRALRASVRTSLAVG